MIGKEIRLIDVNHIKPSPLNPRKLFDTESLQRLADTLKDHGMLQPIRLSAIADKQYEIISGERRWLAAKLAGLPCVPAIVVTQCSHKDAAEQRLIENLAREDLVPIDKALAIVAYRKAHPGEKQEDLAQRLGISPSRFTQCMKLAELPEAIHDYFREPAESDDTGFILSQTHGEVLYKLKDNRRVLSELATKAYNERMSRRELEKLVDAALKPAKPKAEKVVPDALVAVEDWLNELVTQRQCNGVAITTKTRGSKAIVEVSVDPDCDIMATLVRVFGESAGSNSDDGKQDPPDAGSVCVEVAYQKDGTESTELSDAEAWKLVDAVVKGDATLVYEGDSGDGMVFTYAWDGVEYDVYFEEGSALPHELGQSQNRG